MSDKRSVPLPAISLTGHPKLTAFCLAAGTGVIYFFSNPNLSPYDYTFRIAGALLHGRLGLQERPPSWLNEMVPLEGSFYSVFPLGAVLSMLPFALLREAAVVEAFPSSLAVSVTAAAIGLFFFLVTLRYDLSEHKRRLLTAVMMFGTWLWCNLAYGGAWQIALGLSMLGQLGALYFVLVNPRPLAAGFFFALGFGNRTEIILLAPIFMYLACRDAVRSSCEITAAWAALWRFSAFPLLLGAATLAYNYLRFHSPLDFGYARIPAVLDERWYAHGIFSVHSVPLNMRAMLLEGWKRIEHYPFVTPTGFGGSIFLSSPFLIALFRRGAKDVELKVIAWIAIALLTLVLWLHGNPGGWQFSYRYAMVLLPWMFVILLENGPRGVSALEAALFAVSMIVNAYATYLFLWTNYVKP